MPKYKCSGCGHVQEHGSLYTHMKCYQCKAIGYYGDTVTWEPVPDEPEIRPEIKCNVGHLSLSNDGADQNSIEITMREHNTFLVLSTHDHQLQTFLLDCHALLAQMRGDDPAKAKRMIEKAWEMYNFLSGIISTNALRDLPNSTELIRKLLNYIEHGKED